MEIKKVVVIGSGTMGSGIAAHLCNADVPVTLLDLTTEISEKARERIHKSRPPLLIDKSKINNINVGNIEENFDVVKDADWVVEAVVKRMIYSIYKEFIPKNNKWNKYIKSNIKQPNKDLVTHIKNYYKCSAKEAKEYLGILDRTDVDGILTNLGLEKNK